MLPHENPSECGQRHRRYTAGRDQDRRSAVPSGTAGGILLRDHPDRVSGALLSEAEATPAGYAEGLPVQTGGREPYAV